MFFTISIKNLVILFESEYSMFFPSQDDTYQRHPQELRILLKFICFIMMYTDEGFKIIMDGEGIFNRKHELFLRIIKGKKNKSQFHNNLSILREVASFYKRKPLKKRRLESTQKHRITTKSPSRYIFRVVDGSFISLCIGVL